MQLEEIRSVALQFDEISPVTMAIEKKEQRMLGLAFTRTDEILSLWVLTNGKTANERSDIEKRQRALHKKERLGTLKRREQLLKSIDIDNPVMHLRRITAKKKQYKVNSITSSCCCHESNSLQLLTLLMGKEIDFTGWENVDYRETELVTIEFCGQYKKIPQSLKEVEINLDFAPYFQKIPIKKKYLVKQGKQNRKLTITLPDQSKHPIYLLDFFYYDLWKEEEKRFDHPKYQQRFSAEELNQMKKNFYQSLNEHYPPGTKIPVIEYECEESLSLEFYSQIELNERIKSNYGSCSSMVLLFKPEKKEGENGLYRRQCALGGMIETPDVLPVELLTVQIKKEYEI